MEQGKEGEKFVKVELILRPPEPGNHTWRLEGEEMTPPQSLAYNTAIMNDARLREELGVFHHTGNEKKGGYQFWEFSKGYVLEEEVVRRIVNEELPKIHQSAEDWFLKSLWILGC